MAEWRRLAGIPRNEFDISSFNFAKDFLPAIEIHDLVQAIVNGLLHKRMIGRLEIARAMLEARGLHGKDRRQQILGSVSLQMGWHLLPAAMPQHGQSPRHIPTPTNTEHGHGQQCLNEHIPRNRRLEQREHLLERETLLRTDRQHDAVVVWRSPVAQNRSCGRSTYGKPAPTPD